MKHRNSKIRDIVVNAWGGVLGGGFVTTLFLALQISQENLLQENSSASTDISLGERLQFVSYKLNGCGDNINSGDSTEAMFYALYILDDSLSLSDVRSSICKDAFLTRLPGSDDKYIQVSSFNEKASAIEDAHILQSLGIESAVRALRISLDESDVYIADLGAVELDEVVRDTWLDLIPDPEYVFPEDNDMFKDFIIPPDDAPDPSSPDLLESAEKENGGVAE